MTGPSTSQQDNKRLARKRPRTSEPETTVCQEWQAGRCTKGKKCLFRHTKYRRTEDDRIATGENGGLNGELEETETNASEEAAAIEQFIVQESNLVTYGAGLEIRKIIPGYDLCQIILKLPIDTKKEDIERLFLKQGLASFDFHVLKSDKDKKLLRVPVVTKMNKKVIGGLRKGRVEFEVRNAIWSSGKPALTLTWPSEQRTTRRSLANSSQVALSTVYQTLRDSKGARMKNFQLSNPDVSSTADHVALTVEFDTWEHAQKTGREIGIIHPDETSPLRCRLYQYSTQIPFAQYKAQKKQWLALEEETPIKIKIVEKEMVTIEVDGMDRTVVAALNTRVEKLARGEVLAGSHWHPSFASSKDSAVFFRNITNASAVHLRYDSDIQALRLYGEPERVDQARRMIQDEVHRRDQVITETTLTDASVAFFMREGFGKLQDLIGEDKVDLKATKKRTTIITRGDEEATHHLRRLLEESLVETGTSAGAGHRTDKPTCPVCLHEAPHPERLGCGHAYCPSCLSNLLTAAADNKTFPIECIGDNGTCNVPIALPFMRRFLPQHTFKNLVEAAFVSYLEKNPEEFQPCGTPDCIQAYRRRKSSKGVVVSCPSCFARTCSCGIAHDNISCKDYEVQNSPELQERLANNLARRKGYRMCPRCKVWVEKVGGCDSMSCRCGSYAYWTTFLNI